MKLSMHQLRSFQSKAESISDHDSTIRSIIDGISHNADGWGEKVRDIFGRNRLSQFRNAELGDIVAHAIAVSLLERRRAMAAEIAGVVDVPSEPNIVAKNVAKGGSQAEKNNGQVIDK